VLSKGFHIDFFLFFFRIGQVLLVSELAPRKVWVVRCWETGCYNDFIKKKILAKEIEFSKYIMVINVLYHLYIVRTLWPFSNGG